MIGFLPQPDGLSAPRSYGNPHNQSTPRTAGNRMGGNIGISRRPPNFAPQQQQRIGIRPEFGQQQHVHQQQQQQQPAYRQQSPGGYGLGMMQHPAMQFFQQSQPPYFQGEMGQPRRGTSHLSFGRQYQ